MAINGLNSGMNNMYNSIFGTGNSNSNSIGGTGLDLGDYYMIQNGSYKKMMKAYYAAEENKGEERESSKEADNKTSLLGVKANAASLNNSLEDLKAMSLYEATGEDKDGNKTYDREKIGKAVKSFVEDYNDYIKSSGDLEDDAILRKTLKMTKNTDANSTLLSKVGIEIKDNNTLSLDEDKLKAARVTDLNTLFNGIGSFGDQIQKAARQSFQQANSLAYQMGRNASYDGKGSYTMLGVTNGVLNRYL